jgi:hemerythrin-like domain-containing protein
MDIVDVLTAHHDVLRRLCMEAKQDHTRFAELQRHLTIHHTMEERYFYDLMANKKGGRHDALEAVNEHHIIELIMHDVDGFPRKHEIFPVKVESLCEYTSHHLDEEEAEIFPLARTLFQLSDLQGLGAKFDQAKEMLLGIKLP